MKINYGDNPRLKTPNWWTLRAFSKHTYFKIHNKFWRFLTENQFPCEEQASSYLEVPTVIGSKGLITYQTQLSFCKTTKTENKAFSLHYIRVKTIHKVLSFKRQILENYEALLQRLRAKRTFFSDYGMYHKYDSFDREDVLNLINMKWRHVILM